jgi:hypothetical protein
VQFEEKKEFKGAEADLAQRIYEVKDLLPIAKDLAQVPDLTPFNTWLSCVNRMAQKRGLDIKSAALKLDANMKDWLELDGFDTYIQKSKYELQLLEIAIDSKKEAIAMVYDLRKAGVGVNDIRNFMEAANLKNNGHSRSEPDTDMDIPPGGLND